MAEVVIRNASVVRASGVQEADIAIEEGRIVEVGPELTATARHEIDATGLTASPGLIDVHVHFNEPGRTDWEGSATGSRSLAAGGGTMFFDMPLNSSPCTVSAAACDLKRAALEQSSITDFALWGGIIPGNRASIPELADSCFTVEALGELGFRYLQSDDPVQTAVASFIHFAHPAFTYKRQDLVRARYVANDERHSGSNSLSNHDDAVASGTLIRLLPHSAATRFVTGIKAATTSAVTARRRHLQRRTQLAESV